MALVFIICIFRQLRARRVLSLFQDVPLRTRRVLISLFKDVPLRTKMLLSPCRLCTAIAPFWFSTEQLWKLIASFWLSTDDLSCHGSVYYTLIIRHWTLTREISGVNLCDAAVVLSGKALYPHLPSPSERTKTNRSPGHSYPSYKQHASLMAR